jgi:hypothetical protein
MNISSVTRRTCVAKTAMQPQERCRSCWLGLTDEAGLGDWRELHARGIDRLAQRPGVSCTCWGQNILESEIKTAARVAALVFGSNLARVDRPANMETFIRSTSTNLSIKRSSESARAGAARQALPACREALQELIRDLGVAFMLLAAQLRDVSTSVRTQSNILKEWILRLQTEGPSAPSFATLKKAFRRCRRERAYCAHRMWRCARQDRSALGRPVGGAISVVGAAFQDV